MSSQAAENRFNPPYPTVEDVTRNKLLDAGIRCVDKYGFKKTNIRMIADESRIARQTVYNYFKNKNALLSAAFAREGVNLGLAAADYIEQFEDAETQFVEAFLYIYEHFPQNPILAMVIDPGNDFFGTVGLSDYNYAQFGELVFAKVFDEHAYLKAQADSIAELWIRGVMSFLTMPGPTQKDRRQLEEFVRQRLVPGLRLKA